MSANVTGPTCWTYRIQQ